MPINIRDFDNNTPLHVAMLNKHYEVAKALVRNGADVNAMNSKRKTVLEDLVTSYKFHGLVPPETAEQMLDCIRFFVSNGANTSMMDPYIKGTTIMHAAANITCERFPELEAIERQYMSDVEQVKTSRTTSRRLSHAVLDINFSTNDSFLAAYKRSLIKFLFDHGGEPDKQNDIGWTPLHTSCSAGQDSIWNSAFLLHLKANIETTTKSGMTPLLLAISEDNILMVHLLLKYGANVSVSDYRGCGPLHISINSYYSYRQRDICATLLDHGAELELLNNDNYSPFLLACASKHDSADEIVRELQQRGADITATDNKEKSGLHLACEVEAEWRVDFLLASGANVHAEDEWDQTPLHYACKRGNASIVDLLLKCGANINARDGLRGSTPLHRASEYGRKRVVELLLKSGADITIKTQAGMTPMDDARYQLFYHLHTDLDFEMYRSCSTIDKELQEVIDVFEAWAGDEVQDLANEALGIEEEC
jgi:ankyrin repeat protein